MSRRKKPPQSVDSPTSKEAVEGAETVAVGLSSMAGFEEGAGDVTADVVEDATDAAPPITPLHTIRGDELEITMNVVGDQGFYDELERHAAQVTIDGEPPPSRGEIDDPDERRRLRTIVEALVFASDAPIKAKDLARLAEVATGDIIDALAELRQEYNVRGIRLEEVAGGWVFRTSPEVAPFVRDLTKQRPVKLSRAQVETLAIIAYRQPVTRPEIDEVRGVDSGPVLKVLLERDLVRILGKREEPGRPLIYGTTAHFLEFFGLKSLKDLPTLKEFTELTEESREKYEDELGEPLNGAGGFSSDDEDDDEIPNVGDSSADVNASSDDDDA